MKTKQLKVMISNEDYNSLKDKQKLLGLSSMTALIEKIAREPIVFIDTNVKTVLRSLQLK